MRVAAQISLVGVCLFATAEIWAQTSQFVLEEIIVTARKRLEPLRKTPLSVTAFTQADLEARKLADLSQVAEYAPNVEFDFTAPISGSTNTASVFIRGVGQTDYVPSKDAGVGIYLDGVYIARTVGSVLSLLDVERVELLRGPQGTLFGKNTVGGAINVVTVRPGDAFAGEIDLTLGSYDRTDLRAAIDTPFSDTLSARWSVGIFRRDGHMHRVFAGDYAGNDVEEVARLALRWTPSDRFAANLSVDYSRVDEESTASKLVSTDLRSPVSPFSIGDPQTIFAGQAYNVLIGATDTGASMLFPFLPPLPPDSLPYDRRWLTSSPLETNATGPNYSTLSTFGATAILDWALSPLSVRSITGYRAMDSSFGRDPDGSPLTIGQSEIWVDHSQFSQELQVSTDDNTSNLNFVGGLFYFSEEGRQRDYVPFVNETFLIYEELGIPIPNFLLVNGESSINLIDSFAVYGEATFALTDKLELATGLRHTSEDRTTIANTTQGGLPAVANPRANLEFDETNGNVSLKYQWNESSMGYARYSGAFKSGGFNHRLARPDPDSQLEAPTQFAPEHVESIEIGFKSAIADAMHLNAAVFHSDYRDIQVLVFDLGVPRTINAAAGEIDGAELEIEAVLNDKFRVNFAYGYLDAGYTRLDENIPGAFGAPVDNPLTLNHQFVNTPIHSLALGLATDLRALTWPTRFRIDATYRSDVSNDAINTPELVQPALWLVHANLVTEPVGCQCEISVFVKNLTDEHYFVSGAADSPSAGTAELIMARPREWGLRLRYHFD